MQLGILHARRANISVELALVAVFIFLPLLAGLSDVLFIVAAKYQLNSAREALYAFAWNNPAEATDTTQLGNVLAHVNQHSLPQVTLTSEAYGYDTKDYTSPPWGVAGQSVTVTYQVTSTVALPVPMPFKGWSNPFTVSSSGTVQLQ